MGQVEKTIRGALALKFSSSVTFGQVQVVSKPWFLLLQNIRRQVGGALSVVPGGPGPRGSTPTPASPLL